MGIKTKVRSVFGIKLFCYGKKNRRGKRFWNKIVLLQERKLKCEAFLEQNCSVIGKKTEVRRVFGTKLFCYAKKKRGAKRFRNKIVQLWEREGKREAFLETNCSVIERKTNV